MYDSLRLENISKIYQDLSGETLAIDNFSYTFKNRSFVSIVGPSGCGKSTLLSIISGLESQTSGTIFLDNSKLQRNNCSIGYMLQKDYLLNWRTVYQNVLLGLEIRKMISKESLAYSEELLRKYDLYEFKDKYPSQLSGGMRQRVALIRTLAIKPEILLLDEAFSALDYQTRLTVADDVFKIIKAEGITTIMVTHDIPEGISMADEVIVLTSRPSKIKSCHTISFDIQNRTPINCREQPKFREYFDLIWKELNSDG